MLIRFRKEATNDEQKNEVKGGLVTIAHNTNRRILNKGEKLHQVVGEGAESTTPTSKVKT